MDNILGIHEKALLLRERRTEILANNIANADTPGFKARDIPFEKMLNNELNQNECPLAVTDLLHISTSDIANNNALHYRVPYQSNLDGNTVDAQIEQAHFAQNSIHYMASLNFINQRVHQLLLAIKGE